MSSPLFLTSAASRIAATARDSRSSDSYFRSTCCYILPATDILKLPDALTDEEVTPPNCGIATMISFTEATRIAVGNTVW